VQELVYASDGAVRWAEGPDPVVGDRMAALVAPVAVACCDLDVAVARGRAPLPPPYRLGHEGVAVVVEVGDGVTTVTPGDRVVVPFQLSCGTCSTCRRGNTESCEAVPERAMYGLGPIAGLDGGGFMADRVRVPFADAMLVPAPEGSEAAALASCSDNVPDAWRCVGPYADELAAVDEADRRVLVMGGLSIGLYAAGIAVALGARADYVDTDAGRLAVAERLGARVIEGETPSRSDAPYPITVNTSADPDRLRAALAATWPGGVCTDTGIYYQGDVTLPMLALYSRGVRLVTGRVAARALLPAVLDLVGTGRFDPGVVTGEVVPWTEAASAWPDMTGKTVYVRDASV